MQKFTQAVERQTAMFARGDRLSGGMGTEQFGPRGRESKHAQASLGEQFNQTTKPMGMGEVTENYIRGPAPAMTTRGFEGFQGQRRRPQPYEVSGGYGYNLEAQGYQDRQMSVMEQLNQGSAQFQSEEGARARYQQVTGTGRGRGGQSAWSQLSPFYQRFLALEGVRAAANIAGSVRERSINEQLAMGNQAQLAQANLGLVKEVSSSLPFGIGKIAETAIDPTGQVEGSIRYNLASSQLQEGVMDSRRRFMEQSMQMRESRDVSLSPMGEAQQRAKINTERLQGERAERDKGTAVIQAAVAAHEANVANIQGSAWQRAAAWFPETAGLTRASNWFFGVKNQTSAQRDQALQVENARWASERTKLVGQTQENISAVDQQADHQLSIVNAENQLSINRINTATVGFQNQANLPTATGRELFSRSFALTSLRAQQAAGRSALLGRFTNEENEMQQQHPERLQSMKNMHTAELSAFDREQSQTLGREEYRLDLQGKTTTAGLQGDIRVSQLMAQRRPHEARIQQLVTQGNIDIMNADAADVQLVAQRGTERINAEQASWAHENMLYSMATQATTNFNLQMLNRNPLQAQVGRIQAETKIELERLPNDAPESMRKDIRDKGQAEESYARQQFSDNRYIETQNLRRQVAVSDLLAQAHGPGADVMRRRAEVVNITAGAELNAQQIQMRDATDTANANRARQVGVNQLRAMRSQYLEGFSARAGSANLMNLSQDLGGARNDPAQVLGDIKKGIDELVRRMGNLVAGE
jgi:hypothetical protein